MSWKLLSDEQPPEGVPVWFYEPRDYRTMYVGTLEFVDDAWLVGLCYGSEYYSAKDKHWKCGDSEADDYQPTHWMPLPEPPWGGDDDA